MLCRLAKGLAERLGEEDRPRASTAGGVFALAVEQPLLQLVSTYVRCIIGGGLKEMVDAFNDVKKKIHVNLDARVKVLRGVCFCVCTSCCMAVVQEITLNGLSTACFPSSRQRTSWLLCVPPSARRKWRRHSHTLKSLTSCPHGQQWHVASEWTGCHMCVRLHYLYRSRTRAPPG